MSSEKSLNILSIFLYIFTGDSDLSPILVMSDMTDFLLTPYVRSTASINYFES